MSRCDGSVIASPYTSAFYREAYKRQSTNTSRKGAPPTKGIGVAGRGWQALAPHEYQHKLLKEANKAFVAEPNHPQFYGTTKDASRRFPPNAPHISKPFARPGSSPAVVNPKLGSPSPAPQTPPTYSPSYSPGFNGAQPRPSRVNQTAPASVRVPVFQGSDSKQLSPHLQHHHHFGWSPPLATKQSLPTYTADRPMSGATDYCEKIASHHYDRLGCSHRRPYVLKPVISPSLIRPHIGTPGGSQVF